MKILQTLVFKIKSALWLKKGEPFRFAGELLRFRIGTRPVRTKYRNSKNDNVRFDALQVVLVEEVLSPGDIAVDIGAHCGQYCLLMSARCGHEGQVICFEPDTDALKRLRHNISLNPHLKAPLIFTDALSDRNGLATFFTQGGNSQSSLAVCALPKNGQTTSHF
jgi:hypothetical protein